MISTTKSKETENYDMRYFTKIWSLPLGHFSSLD